MIHMSTGWKLIPPGALCSSGLELNSGQEFNYTAGIGSLCVSEVLVCDVSSWICIAVCDGLQLQNVERVIHVGLDAEDRMVISEVVGELLGEA